MTTATAVTMVHMGLARHSQRRPRGSATQDGRRKAVTPTGPAGMNMLHLSGKVVWRIFCLIRRNVRLAGRTCCTGESRLMGNKEDHTGSKCYLLIRSERMHTYSVTLSSDSHLIYSERPLESRVQGLLISVSRLVERINKVDAHCVISSKA